MPLPSIPPADGYHHLTKLDGSADVKFRGAPSMSQSINTKTVLQHFDGRAWPLAYFGEHNEETWDVEFTIDATVDGDQWTNLRALIDGAQRGNVCVWTDMFGNQFHCVVTPDAATRLILLSGYTRARYQQVKFKITRVE